MAKFKYVGDPRNNFSGPQTGPIHGVMFTKGETTEVDDEAVAAKLRRHSHVVEVKAGRPPSKDHEHK